MPPQPLTPIQKRIFIVLGIIGLIILGFGIYVANYKDWPDLVNGGLLGAGGGMTAISAMMLFHRPDR